MTVSTATLTLLFTDIEGSTELWERDAEAMDQSVTEHFALLRRVIPAHGGTIVKYTGDGIFATFVEPRDGVRAAAHAQQELTERTWPIGTLRVRMGLHTGECSARDGDHYGRAVNKAARIEQAAYGGQILLSAATALLVRDGLQDGLSLAFLGEHHFDGIIDPERIYQLSAPGLVTEHPPLRTRDIGLERLPIEVTPLVGRTEAVASLRRDLMSHRVVSLVGPPGVGKTRMALRAATEVARERGSGVRFIDLTTCRRDESAVATVATSLGVRPSEDDATDFVEGIVRALRATDTLVVLDNCEHLLGPIAPLVETIVSSCARVTILATSRERLGTTPELVVPVRPLGLPVADARKLPDIEAAPAVELLVERARALSPGFELTPENAAAVASVCARCDGLPLAIELAAARLETLSPGELLGALEASIDALEPNDLLATTRQRGLREALDASYEALSGPERQLFDELSTFVGFASVEAVMAVTRVSDDQVRGLLESLVRRSLLVARRSGGWTRFRQLESVRQYAREHGAADEDLLLRHAAHFVEEAEARGRQYMGKDDVTAARAISEQFDDFRLALHRSLERGAYEDAARIVLALHEFALFSMRPELQTWAEAVHPHLSPGDRRRAEIGGVLAIGAWFRGDQQAALALGEEALADAALVDGDVSTIWAHTAMLNAAGFIGDLEHAYEHLLALAQECTATGNPFWQVNAWATESIGLSTVGLHKRALEPASRAVKLAEELGNQGALYWSTHVQGMAMRGLDLDGAEAALERSLAATRANGQRFNEGLVLMEQLEVQIEQGRVGAAAATALDLLGFLEQAGGFAQIWHTVLLSARTLVADGRDEPAALLLTSVLDRPRRPRAGFEEMIGPLVEGLRERLGEEVVEQIEARAMFLTEVNIIETCRRELEGLLRG